MGSFLGWLAKMSNAIASPDPNTGQSPLDSIQGALAGAGAAAHNPAGLEALQEQRQARQSAQDFQLRSMLAKNQQQMAQQNAAREQALNQAQISHLNAQTDALQNPPLKPKEEVWKMSDSVDPATGNLIMYEQNSGQTKVTNFKPKAPTSPTEQPLGADRVSQLNGALLQRYNVLNPRKPLPAAYTLGPTATEGDYSRLAAALGGEENASGVQAQRVAANNRADAKADKPTSDEQRRADLAQNMNENLDQLEGILQRRPDLFGPISGRVTQLKSILGTDDPDVAALNTLKEQMGMAQIGAHSLRNAQHVETAANSIVNSFRNSPEAVAGAIKTARSSLATFLGNANPGSSGTPAPNGKSGGGKANNDPLGIR